MKNKNLFFGLFILIVTTVFITSLTTTSRAYTYNGEDLLGGLGKDILRTLETLLSYELRLPGWGNAVPPQIIPVWVLVLFFTLIYSIIYVLTIKYIPIFKEEKYSNAAKAFAIALSFLVVFGTNLLTRFHHLLTTAGGLAAVGGLLWIVYFFWEFLLKAPIKRMKPWTTKKELEEKRKELEGISKERVNINSIKKLEEQNKKLLSEAEKILKTDEKKEVTLLNKLKDIKSLLIKVKSLDEKDPEAFKKYLNRIVNYIGALLNELRLNKKEGEKGNSSLKEIDETMSSITTQIDNLLRELDKIEKSSTLENKKPLNDIWKNLDNHYSTYLKLKNILFSNNGLKKQLEDTNSSINQGIMQLINLLRQSKIDDAINLIMNLENLLIKREDIIKELEEELNEVKNLDNKLKSLLDELNKVNTQEEKEVKKEEKKTEDIEKVKERLRKRGVWLPD